jgi:hypothetical protein
MSEAPRVRYRSSGALFSFSSADFLAQEPYIRANYVYFDEATRKGFDRLLEMLHAHPEPSATLEMPGPEDRRFVDDLAERLMTQIPGTVLCSVCGLEYDFGQLSRVDLDGQVSCRETACPRGHRLLMTITAISY